MEKALSATRALNIDLLLTELYGETSTGALFHYEHSLGNQNAPWNH